MTSIPVKHPSSQLINVQRKPSKFSLGKATSKQSLPYPMSDENFDYDMTDECQSEKLAFDIEQVKRIESCMTLSTNYDEDQHSIPSSNTTSPFECRRSDCTQGSNNVGGNIFSNFSSDMANE